MKKKLAEEFYKLTEWLKTKTGTEEVLNDFIDRELGDILDCVESRYDEDHFWEMYVTLRIEEMMFRYGIFSMISSRESDRAISFCSIFRLCSRWASS